MAWGQWLRTPPLQPAPRARVRPSSEPSGRVSLASQSGKFHIIHKSSHPFPSWAWEAFGRSLFEPRVLQECHVALLWRNLPQTGQTGAGEPSETRASILRLIPSFLAFCFYVPWPFQPDCKCFLLPVIPDSYMDF